MKKIMFNDKYGLTQAVLEGRKTMTRRMVQKKYLLIYKDMSRLGQPCYPMEEWLIRRAAPYKIGEIIAVAQAYKDIIGDHVFFVSSETGVSVHRAIMEREKGWTNKMFVAAEFMPHHIRITDIKVERLQDISNEDCFKEGILCNHLCDYWFKGYTPSEGGRMFKTPLIAFANLIDKVNGKGTWENNPWVFAYSFELID